jgi:hypothetical protein
VPQQAVQYYRHTGGGVTVGALASETVYRATNGTGGQTTSYAYTWYSGSVQPESVTVTYLFLQPITTASRVSEGQAARTEMRKPRTSRGFLLFGCFMRPLL